MSRGQSRKRNSSYKSAKSDREKRSISKLRKTPKANKNSRTLMFNRSYLRRTKSEINSETLKSKSINEYI